MAKARNGVRYLPQVKKEAVLLRKKGRTYREIVQILGISMGTASLWTKHIVLTALQKAKIESRRNKRTWSVAERDEIRHRLSLYRTKYSKEDLLVRIRDFYTTHGRIPLKREFNAWHVYAVHFDSWNSAVQAAGFDTNPVLFAKKFTAKDGHKCDSFTEKVIDDWLYDKKIEHKRHVPYRGTKYTADFALGQDTLIEFFGLAGVQANYDSIIMKKREVSKKLGLVLIEVYPKDIYPKNNLPKLIKF